MNNYETMVVISEKCEGKIKWFNTKKGFGFICVKDNENDVFFHYSEVMNYTRDLKLEEGDDVQFTLIRTEHGLHADKVIKLPKE